MKPKYYSVKEVSELKGVSRQSVHNDIRAGKLTVETVVGRYVIANDNKLKNYLSEA